MERVNFSYWLKNIPIPSNAYFKNMIFKLESFIEWIRWKVFFYEESQIASQTIADNFGFKSVRTPPKNGYLNLFKINLYEMVRNFKFERVVQNSKVICQKALNASMKTRYYLFLLIRRTTYVSFLRTIVTNYWQTTSQNHTKNKYCCSK